MNPAPDLNVIKNLLAAAQEGYNTPPKVAIASPHGLTGLFTLESIGDDVIKVKDDKGTVCVFPLSYVDYAINMY